MNRFHRRLAVPFGFLMLGACYAAWSQNAQASDVANGKRVYLAVGCFACHGRHGQGGNFNNPAPALAQTQLPVDVFKNFLRVGPNDMPAYVEGVLSDKDAADIYAFVRALPGRRATKDLSILNQ